MAQVKSNILEINEVYKDLNKTLDENIKRLNTGAIAIEKYNKIISIKPSDYSKGLDEMTKKTKELEASQKKLEAQEKKVQKARLDDIRLQKQREQAMDKYEANLQKEIKASERQRILNEKNNREYNKLSKALDNVRNKAKDVMASMFNLERQGKKNTAEYEKLRLKSVALARQTNILDKGVKDIDKSLGQHQREVGNYAIANQNLIPIFGRVNSSLMSMGTSLDDIIAKPSPFKALTDGVVGMGKALIGFMLTPLGATLTILGGLFALVSGNKQTVIDFDAGLKDVGKTTGLAGEELAKLSDETIKLSRNLGVVSTSKLQEYQKVAGQLGVKGVDNILKFSKSLAMLEVASNITGEEGASEIARFLTLTDGGVENINDFGDEIVNLGNNFAATEKEILSTALAVAQNTGVYNISRRQSLALGTALKAVGVEAELAGSSIGRTFGQINKGLRTGKNLETILKLTGKTQEELNKQFKESASSVFVDFIGGLNEIYDAGGDVNEQLDAIGITAVRDQRVLGTLASKGYETLINSMVKATDASGAMQKEFLVASTKLENVSKRIKIAWDNIILTVDSGEGVFSKIAGILGGVLAQALEDLNFMLDRASVNFTLIQKAITDLLPKGGALGGVFDKIFNSMKNLPSTATGLAIAFDILGVIFSVKIPTAIQKAKANFEILKLTIKTLFEFIIRTAPLVKDLLIDFLNPLATADSSKLRSEINKMGSQYISSINKIKGARDKNIKDIFTNFVTQKTIVEKEIALSKELSKTIDEETKTTNGNTKSVKENTKAKEKQREVIEGSVEWMELEISKLRELQKQQSTTTKEFNKFDDEINILINTLDMLIGKQKEIKDNANDDNIISLSAEDLARESDESIEVFTYFQERMQAKAKEMMNSFADNSGFTNMFAILNGEIEGFGTNWLITADAIMLASKEMFAFINAMGQENFEISYQQEQQRKETALMFAGESAEARAEIERESERRTREIRTREAQAQKKQAIFNATIDMIRGIMGAVAQNPLTLGMPQSAIIGALGLANIARISSQQIPQFWTGTDNAPEGLALTQERGREIITDAKGNIKSFGSDKGATLTNLSKGDKVLKHSDTMRELNNMLMTNDIKPYSTSVNIDLTPLNNRLDKLSDIVSNKTEFQYIVDRNGEKIFKRINGRREEIKNAKLNSNNRNV